MSREWHENGRVHRLDGPAREFYYQSGQLKSCEWYIGNQRHRETGPAVEYFSKDGRRTGATYYLNGNLILKAEFKRHLALQKLAYHHMNQSGVSL